ncbi:MAG TPA: acetoacetyl-CoA reductase [Cycloclasticus sp.]|jgi:3-oxoacyl-[acyl-carrier-protein] reductase (EC 1.1.1.100)|nr:acetoacetyl-CoA reductase [Cycloclasticus sp.]HIL92882.1 acetoacetyl-CoA reductase [Cycloclasticus sp.]
MNNSVALVTGGLGGIGSEISRKLSENGYTVVATTFNKDIEKADEWIAEQKTAGFEFIVEEADVTNFEACGKMVEHVEKTVGPIEVLVNCAGITRDSFLKNMDESNWDAVLSTNLDGVFNMTKSVLDFMLTRESGRIINISSVNGQRGQFGQTNYSAAKAGMHGFTMALSQEVARKGITVNSVSPGYIATNMVMAIDEEIRDNLISQIPMQRMGKPAEIANTVGFLASGDASYITGANIPVNGGLFTSF